MSKYIVPYLESVRKTDQKFIDAFVGGANIVCKMSGPREAYDINEYLISLYIALQNGYELPDSISEEQYNYIKEHKDEDKALTAFVGFGCSYLGKWFGGYARSKKVKGSFCLVSKSQIMKQMQTLYDVKFECADYRELSFKNCLIYCDPPYEGACRFNGTPEFDHFQFWNIMRDWSKENNVYISEYNAPEDFECVLEVPVKASVRNSANVCYERVERLYKMKV